MQVSRPLHAVKAIRDILSQLTGSPIRIKANMGRSKIFEREGIVVQAHPALFVVEVKEKRQRTTRASYQYTDVLTGQVELTHPETGEAIVPWIDSSNG